MHGIEQRGAAVAARTSAFDLTDLDPSLTRAATVYGYLRIGGRVMGEMTTGERQMKTVLFGCRYRLAELEDSDLRLDFTDHRPLVRFSFRF